MRTSTPLRVALALTAVSVTVGASLVNGETAGQTLIGDALVNALRQGGYVIVMRHASSPRQVPDRQTASAGNIAFERQLDEAGRASASAMGNALRDLKIPVGNVFTSPTFRALETVRLANLPNPRPVPELGEGGESMQGVTPAQSVWLQKRVTEFSNGSCTVLVTHLPNIAAAFPALATGVTEGEALVFGPDGKGGATLVARVKIEEWPRLK
jgi:phosphohistidine phosphatase SixA